MVIFDDGWETAEWVVQQDQWKFVAGLAHAWTCIPRQSTTGELSIEDVPLVGLDRLNKRLVTSRVFEEDLLEIDEITDTTDTAAAAHMTAYRVHLTLRRSEWNLAENGAAAAVALSHPRDRHRFAPRTESVAQARRGGAFRFPSRKRTRSHTFSPISGGSALPRSASM